MNFSDSSSHSGFYGSHLSPDGSLNSSASSMDGSSTHNGGFSATNPEPSLEVMLQKINAMRIDAQKLQASLKNDANSKNDSQATEVIPSGPRKPGQGCEEVDQAIMLAERTDTGGVRLRITLLAAGFIIGPIGGCIREISSLTSAEIRSRTVSADSLCPRDCREFTIEGSSEDSIAHAMNIIFEAVKRYKTLCEGNCAGQVVSRSQHVAGVEFFYQPPPRSVVPFAAVLKGHSKRTKTLVKMNGNPNAPRQSPAPRPSTFKEAVISPTAGTTVRTTTRFSPLKRAASSPPGSVSSGSESPTPRGIIGVHQNVCAEQIYAANPIMAAKLAKANSDTLSLERFNLQSAFQSPTSAHSLAETAAAATGLPFVSLTSAVQNAPSSPQNNANYVLTTQSGNVLVPLNLVVAPNQPAQQHQQQEAPPAAAAMMQGIHAQQQQVSQPPQEQQASLFSSVDLLSALTSQLQANLGFSGQQQQQEHSAAAAPFFGHYQADFQASQAQSQPQQVVYQEDQSMNSAFAAVTESFFNQNGRSTPAAVAASVSSLQTALSGESAFSFVSEPVLRAALRPPLPPAPHVSDNVEGSAFQSAFALPFFFQDHCRSSLELAPATPAAPAPSRANSAPNNLARASSMAPTILNRATSGSLFQIAEVSAAMAEAAAAGHHDVAAAVWGSPPAALSHQAPDSTSPQTPQAPDAPWEAQEDPNYQFNLLPKSIWN